MIIQQNSKRIVLNNFFNTKNFLISLMVATFMVFASGANSFTEPEELFSIIIGAGLFTLAAGLLLWARDVSKNLYH
ncbi:MAG: hypothetical protein HOH19_10055 [Kordiimonadaceae bacterium]|jgi:hypothetical protein|nr:hypothetical protein [Kordiimonadaceae bacterium]MBT6032907.1 hypothetical protein [Kordiimonadaceae bacterium]